MLATARRRPASRCASIRAQIGGAPAWLKPAKFAASIAIYTLTLAWVFTYLPEWVQDAAHRELDHDA